MGDSGKRSSLKRFFSRSSSSGSIKRRSSSSASMVATRPKLKETDPMLNALFENIVDLQNVLLKLKDEVIAFLTGVDALCGGMKVLSEGINSVCKSDDALAEDTEKYHKTISGVMSLEDKAPGEKKSARRALLEFIHNKVLGPLDVNLVVLSSVLKRMLDRDAKLSLARRSGGKAADAAETACLFDELTALHQHRYDFIRGPYQSLKKAQHAFFVDCAQIMEASLGIAPRPSTSADPKKAPPALASPGAQEMLQRTGGIHQESAVKYAENDGEITDIDEDSDLDEADRARMRNATLRRQRARKETKKKKGKQPLKPPDDQPIKIATPIDGAFDPSLDAPSGGRVYSMLGKASAKDAIATRLTKDEPETELMKRAKALKLTGLKSGGPVKIKLSAKGFKSSSSSSLRRQSSSNISLSLPDPADNMNGEIPMKIAPMGPPPGSGEIPMKIAPMAPQPGSGEIPMKITPAQNATKTTTRKKKKKKRQPEAQLNLPDADAGGGESASPNSASDTVDDPSPVEEMMQREMQRQKSLSETLGFDDDDFSPVILDE